MNEIRKVTAPISMPLYERVTGYLAKYRGKPGYPQTLREFLVLAIEHLLVDLEADAAEDSPTSEHVLANMHHPYSDACGELESTL